MIKKRRDYDYTSDSEYSDFEGLDTDAVPAVIHDYEEKISPGVNVPQIITDIIFLIFSFLPSQYIILTRGVNKEWYDCVKKTPLTIEINHKNDGCMSNTKRRIEFEKSISSFEKRKKIKFNADRHLRETQYFVSHVISSYDDTEEIYFNISRGAFKNALPLEVFSIKENITKLSLSGVMLLTDFWKAVSISNVLKIELDNCCVKLEHPQNFVLTNLKELRIKDKNLPYECTDIMYIKTPNLEYLETPYMLQQTYTKLKTLKYRVQSNLLNQLEICHVLSKICIEADYVSGDMINLLRDSKIENIHLGWIGVSTVSNVLKLLNPMSLKICLRFSKHNEYKDVCTLLNSSNIKKVYIRGYIDASASSFTRYLDEKIKVYVID